jgi:two-component system chemotaxis response regulator CheY
VTRVLIVEDDPDIREFMAALFGVWASGYTAITATDGQDALEQIQGRYPLPDVILLDLMMPRVDGWEFRRRQLADPELAGIPVIAVTAYWDCEQVRDQLGTRCVMKPIRFDELIAEVQAAVSRN